jgi:cell wall-associated NlpC family hydrolase
VKPVAVGAGGLAVLLALPFLFVVLAVGLPGSSGLTALTGGANGDSRLAWAEAFAAHLGALSEPAVKFALAWATEEGAPPEANNPLNSSLPEPGSVSVTGGPGGVRMYATLNTGLAADLATITTADPALGYQAIVGGLRHADVAAAATALQHSSWCFDPTGPLGHECPGYGAAIERIVDSFGDPAVFRRAASVLAGTTPLAGFNGASTSPSEGQPAAGLSTASGLSASGSLGPLFAWLSAQVGKPYVWGGTGPQGYDCSGLTMMGYAQVGVPLPRTAAAQYAATAKTAVPFAAAEPGDLVFWAFRPSDPATIHHVAVYVGAGRIIEAATEGVPIHDVPVWDDGGRLAVVTRPALLASVGAP